MRMATDAPTAAPSRTEMSSAPSEADVETLLSQRLLQGFLLLEQPCPVCATPLVRQEDPLPSDDNASAVSAIEPIQGVPFCVCCRAHVVTQESEIALLSGDSVDENESGVGHKPRPVKGSILAAVPSHSVTPPVASQGGQRDQGDDFEEDFLEILTENDSTIATVEDVKETKPQSIERPHVAPEPHTKPSPPTGRSVDSSTQATAKVSQVVLDDLNEDSIELVRQPTMASVQGEIDRDDEIVCTTDDQDKEILEIEVITKVHSMLDAMEELTVDGSYMAGSVYNSEDEHHGDENGEETEFIVGLQKEKEMSAGVTTEDAKSSNTSDKSGKPSRESLSPSARIAQRNLLDSRHLVSEEDRPYWPDYAERRQIATKILADKMMEGLELREEQCQRCSMPIMNEGQSDSSGFCTVCPVLDENMATKRLEDETQVELARRRVVQEEEKQRLAQKKLELEKSIDIQRKLRAKKHSKLDQVKSRAVSMALVVAASTTSVEVTTANNKSSKVSPSSQSPSSVETPALCPKQEKDEASKAAMDSVDAPQEERQGQNSKAADNIEKDEESTLQQAKTTGAQSISTNPTAVSTLVQANTMSDIHTPKLMELNVKTVEVPDVSMQRSVVTRDLQPADCVEATLGPLKFLDSDHFSVIPPLSLQKMEIEKEAAHLLREVGKAEEAKRESLRVLDEATKAHTEKKNRAVELTEEIAREQTLVLKETERLQQLEAQQLEQNRTRTSRSASISNKYNEELKLQAEIEKAEKARDAAEFERQRLADEKQALEESNLLSELEKDANKKQREAEEAMGRAKAAMEKVVAVQRKIFAKTIAAGEVSVVAEAEKISRADTEDYHERNIKPSASEVCRERWETLRCESKAVRTRRLLSGWTTLPELCRGQECQSSPLITNSEEKECVVCGGCGSGRDGAYAQMINGDDESEDGCSQIILLQETTPSVLSFPTDFAGTFSVEEHTTAILSPTPRKCVEEIHKDFERKRNAVSKEIGKKMLQGWILLDLSCPNCVMPLMTDGDGEREICILCGDVGQFGNYDDSTKATSVATTVDKTVPYAQLNASDKIEVMSSRDCSTVGLNTLSTKENRKISCVLSTHTSREAAEIPRAAVESAKKNAKGAHSVESQVPCKNQQSTGDEVNSLSITANSGPNYVKKTGNAAKTRLPAVVEEDRTSLETSLCPSRSRIGNVESKSAPGKGKLQTHRKLDPSPRSSFNQKKPSLNACKEPPSTIKSPTVRSFSDSFEMSKRIQGSHQRRHRKDPEVLVTSTSAETKVVEPASSMDLSLGGDLASSTIASPSSIRNKAGRTQSDTKRSAANSISHILSPKNRHRSETLRGDPPAIQGCSLGRRNAKEVEGRRADELPTEHSKTTHDTPTSEGDSQSKVEWTRKLAESNDENREIAAEGTDDHPIRDEGRFETNECIRGSEDNNGVQQIPIDFNRGIEQPIGDLITVAKARQPCYTDMSVRTPMDDQSSKGIPLHALHLPSPGMTAASAPYLSPTSYRESAPASVAPTLGSFRPRITPETSRRDRKRTLLSGLRPAFPYQSGILHSKAKPPQSDFVVYGGPLETPELLVTGTNASVTSEAIDTLLARIEETKAQLEEHPDGDNLENQNRLSQLLANLASAAEAMQRFDELEAIDRFDEMTDTWCRSAERI